MRKGKRGFVFLETGATPSVAKDAYGRNIKREERKKTFMKDGRKEGRKAFMTDERKEGLYEGRKEGRKKK
jgi:hypothetical protein